MAYEPTEWKSGDVISSQKLNKIEQGIAKNVLYVNVSDEGVLDKTWQEINDAGLCIIEKQYTTAQGVAVKKQEFAALVVDSGSSVFVVQTVTIVNEMLPSVSVGMAMYVATSADGYPTSVNQS